MKAQELRDKLAGVRSFDVMIDGKRAIDTIVDITNNTVHILSAPASSVDIEKLSANAEKSKGEVKKSDMDKLFSGLGKKEGEK